MIRARDRRGPCGRTRRASRHVAALAVLLVVGLGGCAAPRAPDPGATAASPPAATPGAESIALTNPGFESDRRGLGPNPEGWRTVQHAGAPAYAFTLDRDVRHSGERSMRIENLTPEVYGMVLQSVPAAPHAGRTLRFSVWLRTQEVRGNAFGRGATPTLQAMAGGSPAASASFDVAAIAGTAEWTRREVTLIVPRHAESIEVGVMLTGSGTAWLDDAALEVLSASR